MVSLAQPALPLFADSMFLSSMAALMPAPTAPFPGSGPLPYKTNQNGATVRHSRYRGVTWDKRDQRWRVRINCLGVQHHVGRYTQELQAARVYDRVSYLLYGDDAITNFGVASAAADNCSIPRTMLQLKERYQRWKAQQQDLQQQQQQLQMSSLLAESNVSLVNSAARAGPGGPLAAPAAALPPLDLLQASAHLSALSLSSGAAPTSMGLNAWPVGALPTPETLASWLAASTAASLPLDALPGLAAAAPSLLQQHASLAAAAAASAGHLAGADYTSAGLLAAGAPASTTLPLPSAASLGLLGGGVPGQLAASNPVGAALGGCNVTALPGGSLPISQGLLMGYNAHLLAASLQQAALS